MKEKKYLDLMMIQFRNSMRRRPICYHRANAPYDVLVLIYILLETVV
jgi:hypothetical protein